ncbi:hypothetical protein BOTBODRAFT_192737 [Botryobasidium botryosum FD-172 SS1]|uniref:F-box domain-containing protein n=1 Tax=Botryobasidium botryosum (strain FD-172 SS1) TaxID=930990 RepID=A0A067M5X5_BOTB1|nr:hypothetical protein BOTBODRAFT_192737 [Botryobasidium botryosum FD-172 SS1]
MEKIAVDAIPQLIQRLCKEIFRKSEASAEEDLRTQAIPFDYTPPFQIAKPVDTGVLEHMDEELKVMTRACDYAVHAMVTYTSKVLNSVQARRNEHCPIYRLPNDIIPTIFHFARQCSLGSNDGLLRSAPVNLSQVSRWWRNIALNTPALWTRIDSQNVILAELLAKRSKNELLNINVKLTPTFAYIPIRTKHFTKFLTAHIHRWESFTLRGNCSFKALDSPAPNLRVLQLHTDEWDDDKCYFDANIFSNHTPLLHTLTLEGFMIYAGTQFHAGLKILHLYNVQIFGAPQRFTAASLAACPLLRELILHDIYFDPIDSPLLGNTCVSLHYLEVMRLKMEDEDIISMISSIRAPPSLRLCITLGYYNHIHTMFPVSQSHQWHSPDIAAIDTLSITVDPADGVCVVGESSQSHTPLLELRFTQSHRDAGEIAGIPACFRSTMRLVALSIHGTSGRVIMNKNTFSILLSHSPALTTISLRSVPAELVGELVFTQAAPYCPLLQSLHLQEMDLRTADPILRQLAESRRHVNTEGCHDLSRIEISNCRGVKEATVVWLRGFLIEVVWDGGRKEESV